MTDTKPTKPTKPNRATKPSNPSTYYVDKAEFQAAMVIRREIVDKVKAEGKDKPPISAYVAKCIFDIATRLSYSPNFIGYSYRDEMISDGIENCLRYVDNYDCINYQNPFAYFTQVNWYAFIRRIRREKKQSALKAKLIREMAFDVFTLQEHDETGEFSHAYMDYLQMHDDTDTTAFDKKPKAKKGAVTEVEPVSEHVMDV